MKVEPLISRLEIERAEKLMRDAGPHLTRFFNIPEIATDGATITTDGGCDGLRPVENKEDEPCQE
jgi:hypothetical protein